MVRPLLFITLILLVFGLVVLSSAGIVEGQKKFGSAYFYLNQQLIAVGIGLAFMFVLYKVNYKFWKRVSFLVLFGALGLMILVFMPKFGYDLKGATRWLNIAGFSFQPSEVLKLGLIIYLAAWFGNREERAKNWIYGTVPFLVVLGLVAVLLLMQPDIGTLIVVTTISGGIYFLAGAPIKHFLLIGALVVAAFAVMVVVEPYRFERIKTFFDPSIDPRGSSYQVNQSLIGIGSGGVFGVGFGKSTQKFGFLPDVINDSIFAVVAEELGFVGSTSLLGLFVVFAFVIIKTANNIADKFGKLFVMGMGVWVVGQAFLNIAAISGLVPLTGIPLPFVSYGGTAITTLLAGMGIALNIAKKA